MSVKAYRNGFRFVRYAPRDGYSNYFLLPNEVFSLGLAAGEIALYAYLVRCEDRETYKCHPSYKTIGKALQISARTVAKYVRTLEQKGLIRTEQTVITKRNGKKQEKGVGSMRCSTPIYFVRQCRSLWGFRRFQCNKKVTSFAGYLG